jgi:LacI family transcriptional regulator
MLRDKQVDGIILSSTMDTPEHIVQIHKDQIPLVLIDRVYEEVKTNQVMVDNRKGAENAVLNFLVNGHRNIALMVISPPHISTQVERYNGYCDALKAYGLPIRKEYVCIVQRENIVTSIGRIVDEWKQMNITPSALFVANNQLAQGCLESFKSKGISIPDHISMISFDDVDLFRYANPPISSVRQPVEEIAFNAVEILLNDIQTKNDPEPADKKSVCLQTEMIERLSVMKCS